MRTWINFSVTAHSVRINQVLEPTRKLITPIISRGHLVRLYYVQKRSNCAPSRCLLHRNDKYNWNKIKYNHNNLRNYRLGWFGRAVNQRRATSIHRSCIFRWRRYWNNSKRDKSLSFCGFERSNCVDLSLLQTKLFDGDLSFDSTPIIMVF